MPGGAEGDYLEPDIVFVRKDHEDLISDRGVEGPPDLLVEILSPSSARRDRGIKLERYRLYSVPEYWIVDADARTIEVWDLAAGASTPTVHDDAATLEWTPDPDGPTLGIELKDGFAD